jgi:hypothetical protein
MPRASGDEEQLEIVDEGVGVDAEVGGGLGEVGAGMGVEVGHETEQAGQSLTR